ncbi:MAG: hypothetical protein ABR525_10025 [Candidatus Limnocylindria bacterium]
MPTPCANFSFLLSADDSRSTLGNVVQACAALGRLPPETTYLPSGVQRSSLTIDPRPPAGIPRGVALSYISAGEDVAFLDVRKGSATGAVDGQPVDIGGAQGRVSTRALPDGTQFRSYIWTRDGMVLVMRVHLIHGITEEMADRMAASVH